MKGKFAAAVLFTAMGLASTAMAQDGEVNFTGKIIEAGCKINGSVTSSQDVKLGEVSKQRLPPLAQRQQPPSFHWY